jgi:hypothetical protein
VFLFLNFISNFFKKIPQQHVGHHLIFLDLLAINR